jgi:GTPase SAR1 family protein
LEYAEKEIEYIVRYKEEDDTKRIPIILVGTKCDLEDRKITFEEGLEIAKKYEILYFEISSKICINVEETIFSLIDEIYKKNVDIPKENINKKECLLM